MTIANGISQPIYAIGTHRGINWRLRESGSLLQFFRVLSDLFKKKQPVRTEWVTYVLTDYAALYLFYVYIQESGIRSGRGYSGITGDGNTDL